VARERSSGRSGGRPRRAEEDRRASGREAASSDGPGARRAVARLLSRAARRRTGDSCRRSTIRDVEAQFRAAEIEWRAEQNGIDYPEDFS